MLGLKLNIIFISNLSVETKTFDDTYINDTKNYNLNNKNYIQARLLSMDCFLNYYLVKYNFEIDLIIKIVRFLL